MKHKRPQLRRCGGCHSPGHNKATCPISNKVETVVTETKKPISQPTLSKPSTTPLKFFVHHVNTPAPSSPHVVDLKSSNSQIWKDVDMVSPANDIESLYHSYHTKPDKISTKIVNPALFTDLRRPAPELNSVKKVKIEKIQKPKKVRNDFNFFKKVSTIDFKSKVSILIPSRAALATALILTLSFSIPGPLTGYFESLAETKDQVVESGTAGFLALQESATALKSANITSAEKATADAIKNFDSALGTLTSKHTILISVAKSVPIFGSQVEGREKILLAGEQIAVGNSYLIAGLKKIESEPNLPLTEKLNTIVGALRLANPNYREAITNLNSVDPSVVPYEFRSQFSNYRELFKNLVEDFQRIANLNDTFQEIFGGNGLRRYLLVFQNPAELRPTGGFMGSFAIIDVKNGAIANLEIPAGGTYDLQGQLTEYVTPPLPLTVNNKRWEFQDSNWYPDFKASAEKMLWFYRHSRNVTADGVIAINATVLERILAITGPIIDQNRDLALSSSTALVTIQKVVEKGPEKAENKPKQILADLAPGILTSIQNASAQNLLPILSSLQEALDQKEIQAYFTDTKVQKEISNSGWSGTILNTSNNSDYLLVINTNLQGQKSDARIKQTINHQAIVDENGEITNTVVINREHTGNSQEEFYGTTNVDYLRVYVPKGSTLISANGFTWPDEKNFRAPEPWFVADQDLHIKETEIEIDQISGTRITNEFGKTAFGNWIITEPGQTSRVEFTYKLPFKIATSTLPQNSIFNKIVSTVNTPSANYELIAQKQSGINSDFQSQIIFPYGWHTEKIFGQDIQKASNGAYINNYSLSQDSIWGMTAKKIK